MRSIVHLLSYPLRGFVTFSGRHLGPASLGGKITISNEQRPLIENAGRFDMEVYFAKDPSGDEALVFLRPEELAQRD